MHVNQILEPHGSGTSRLFESRSFGSGWFESQSRWLESQSSCSGARYGYYDEVTDVSVSLEGS